MNITLQIDYETMIACRVALSHLSKEATRRDDHTNATYFKDHYDQFLAAYGAALKLVSMDMLAKLHLPSLPQEISP